MLYRFKSPVAAEVIMLQANAEELLKICGKSPGPTGIFTVEQAHAAIEALQREIDRREAMTAAEKADPEKEDEIVPLRNRAKPLMALLSESAARDKSVVWGV